MWNPASALGIRNLLVVSLNRIWVHPMWDIDRTLGIILHCISAALCILHLCTICHVLAMAEGGFFTPFPFHLFVVKPLWKQTSLCPCLVGLKHTSRVKIREPCLFPQVLPVTGDMSQASHSFIRQIFPKWLFCDWQCPRHWNITGN